MRKSSKVRVAPLAIYQPTLLTFAICLFLFPIINSCPDTKDDPSFETLSHLFIRKLFRSGYTRPQPLKIIIVGEGRSGTTFLGNLFNLHNDVSYSFEPCRPLIRRNNKKSMMIPYSQVYRQCEQYLDRILTCRMTCKDIQMMYTDKTAIKKWSEFLHFQQRALSLKNGKPISCNDKLEMNWRCSNREAIVVKTIRLRGVPRRFIAGNAKILHLIRDPRAVALSQSRTIGFDRVFPRPKVETPQKSLRRLKQYAYLICDRMKKKLDDSRSLSSDSYKRIRYEDLFDKPSKIAEEVFEWAGLHGVPRHVHHWIDLQTTARKGGAGHYAYSTARNSSNILDRWTQQLSLEEMLMTTEVCFEVLKELRYPLFNAGLQQDPSM